MIKLVETFTDIHGKSQVHEKRFLSRTLMLKKLRDSSKGMPSWIKYELRKYGKSRIEYTNGTSIIEVVEIPDTMKVVD